MPPPQPKRRLGIILAAITVVVALIAGGLVIYFANRNTSPNTAADQPPAVALAGKDTPQNAAAAFAVTVSKRDTIGMLDLLDPTEARLFRDFTGDIFKELQRLEVIQPTVDPAKITEGVIEVSGLKFDDTATEKINDHVTVVPLAAVKVVITHDPAKMPLTERFLKLAGTKRGEIAATSMTIEVNGSLMKFTEADGKVKEHKLLRPLRIATVKRDGGWYPSVFYTVADFAVQKKRETNPEFGKNLTPIAPVGSDTPQGAVENVIGSLVKSDIHAIIAGLAPDEMGALQDYGSLLPPTNKVANVFAGIEVSDLDFNISDVTGGKRVSLKSLSMSMGAHKLSLSIDQNSGAITVNQNGQTITLTPEQIFAQQPGAAKQLDAKSQQVTIRMIKQLLNAGVITVNVNGKWYVSPLRTGSDLMVSLLRSMEPGDFEHFAMLPNK